MTTKKVTISVVAVAVVQLLVGAKIFVTFSDMQAYAVSKSEFSLIREDLKEIKADQKDIRNDQKTLLEKLYVCKK